MNENAELHVPLEQRAARSLKRKQSNFFTKGLINIQIFSICLIVLGVLVLIFARFGVMVASPFFMGGFGLIWIAVGGLLLWAVITYQRASSPKTGA